MAFVDSRLIFDSPLVSRVSPADVNPNHPFFLPSLSIFFFALSSHVKSKKRERRKRNGLTIFLLICDKQRMGGRIGLAGMRSSSLERVQMPRKCENEGCSQAAAAAAAAAVAARAVPSD